MSKRKLRFGIVGVGAIAEFHAIALKRAFHAELTAVCGRDEKRTEEFAKKHGAHGYTDIHAFLLSGIDAITIATPSGSHLQMGVLAAKAGKHILCEKPLEITAEKASQFVQVCEEKNVQLGVFFQARFDRCTQLAKEAIEKGRLGRILLASCQMRWFRSQEYYDSAAWRGTWDLDGGGALMNQGIHTIDMLLHLVGRPVEVFSFQGPVTHKRIEVEDTLSATLRFENGAIGTIEASTSCAPGFPRRIEISGEKGTIVIEDNRIVRWKFVDNRPSDDDIAVTIEKGRQGGGGAADPMSIDVSGHCAVVDDFIESIQNKRKPAIDGKEGKVAVDCVCAIYQSIQTGKSVRLG